MALSKTDEMFLFLWSFYLLLKNNSEMSKKVEKKAHPSGIEAVKQKEKRE